MTAGQQFVKWLKPVGCGIFLLVFVLFFIMCFTAKAPVEGYTVPHDSQYYAEHLDELKTELETNLFPRLDGIIICVCNTNDRGRCCDFYKSVFHLIHSFSMINRFSP